MAQDPPYLHHPSDFLVVQLSFAATSCVVMGDWKLEVFRMLVYVSFPVGMFVLFNSPGFYEEAIMEARRKLARSIDKESNDELTSYIQEQKRKQLERQIDEIKSRKAPEV